ncbi:MAG: transglycosylase domain-containing protein, partial [Gammaproteobacteria bacterium]
MWPALTTVCGVVLTLTGVFLYLNPQIPSAESYRHLRLETPLRVFTADGQLIAEFGQRRLIPMPIDAMPELFLTAVLDTEDKRFYDHGGIDLITLMNAGFELVRNRGQIRGPGGSTITMQLARNISFTLERTFIRKFKEILLALKIERELDKDEILELYLNVIPFGKGAYGAEAAARTYYGRGLSELNLSQLAMLAGIPQAPTAGNPINGPERALKRRNLVLARMLEQDHIDQGESDIAVAAPITAQRHGRTTE